MAFEFTGKYAKYKDSLMDFTALKEYMDRNKEMSEEEAEKYMEEHLYKEGDDDDMITRWIAGISPKISDFNYSLDEYTKQTHYFNRHPEMAKYMNYKFRLMDIFEKIRIMEKYNCYKLIPDNYKVFIEKAVKPFGSQELFEQILDYVITDTLKGNLDLDFFDPGCPVVKVAEKNGYFEKHPEMKKYV